MVIDFIEPSMERTIELIEHTFNSHWEDVKEIAPLDPCYELYLELESTNMVYNLLALENEKLVGYVIFIISKHHHHQSTLWALSDILYISPDYRGRGLCLNMLETAEKALRDRGVEVIIVNSRAHKDFGALLAKSGYNPYEKSYSKILGD